MSAEQRQNALKLLDLLENKLSDAQCDMTHWVVRPEEKGVLPPQELRGTHECGTAACLAGWAALMIAPTKDTSDDNTIFAHRIGLMVPIDLATLINKKWHGTIVGKDARSEDGEWATVSVHDIGREVLGYDISEWFDDAEGPEECEMSDRAWMIAVLRRELDLPHSPQLESRSERRDDYDDDPYERD